MSRTAGQVKLAVSEPAVEHRHRAPAAAAEPAHQLGSERDLRDEHQCPTAPGQRVLGRAFPRTFKLALIDKDVRIGAQFLREQNVPSPLIQLTAELFAAAHAELGEEADHVEAVKVIERAGGAEIR